MRRDVFDHYVPRLVREWVLDDADLHRTHRRLDGTAVFADVSGFTKMSERLARRGKVGAETIGNVIDTCFTQLLAVAHSRGGTLLQFGGDAVLLFYRGDAHERRAAASALEMRRTMRSLVDLTQRIAGVRLSMTTGVHTGAYDFFLVGRSHRQLVVGGPVASELVRLEAAAERGQILAGAATAAALSRRNLGPLHELGRRLAGRIDAPCEPVHFLPVPVDMSAFVAAGLRDSLIGEPISSEHRTATVAFVEYRGIDQVIAMLGTDEAARRLDALMVGVQDAIDHRGICFQSADLVIDGGKFYLSAGAPRSSGHDEEQMLLALTEIVRLDVGLRLRAGVNSGPVFMGEIRSPHRSTFITMGDPVNLAARVMSNATPGSVLSTQSVLDRSRTLFEHSEVPPFMVKGKAKPVAAFAVGSARSQRTEIAASNLPLVGRHDEVELFRAALGSAELGRGSVLQVVAEAGAGKSRLLDEFATMSSPLGCHRVRCRLYQVSTPYFPFGELLPALLGAPPAGLTAGWLRECVEDRAPELLPWLALIATACGLTIEPSGEVEALEPEFRRVRLAEAVVALLSIMLVEPTVVCIDDAQWMDDASCDLLDAIVRDVASRPWVVVVGLRPDPGGPTSRIRPPDHRIEVQALGVGALAELATFITADAPLPRHQVDALIDRCGGNPLFLLELLNAARAGEDVASLPRSVEGLLTARIDRLAVAERNLLRHLSVLGPGFDATYIADVASGGYERWDEGLARLGEFLRRDDAGWVWFRHHLVRDVAYEGLPFSVRRELHERVAESILRRVGDDVADVAGLLSLHFFRAGRPDEAWRYSTIAGDRATSIFANVDAISLYRRALQAARQIDLEPHRRAATLAALGDVEDLAGLFADARRSYTAARHLVHGDPIAESEMLLKTAFVDERLGRFAVAVRTIRRGLRTLDGCTGSAADERRAELLGWYAAIRVRQGRFADAADASADAIRLATAGGETATLARAMMTRDYALNSLGDDGDLAGTRRALEIYTELGDIAGEATAANVLGGYAYFTSQWDEAVTLYRRSRAARERTGDPVGVAIANANLAEILVEQGALNEAETLLVAASAAWRASGDAWGVAYTRRLRGTGRGRAGDDVDARVLLQQARADFAKLGAIPDVVETDVAIAELHLLGGDASEALSMLDRIIASDPAGSGLEHLIPATHRLRGMACAVLSAGSGDEDLDIAERVARQRGADHELALVVRARRLTWSWRGEQIDRALAAEAAAIDVRLGLGPRREPRPPCVVNGTELPGPR